MLFLISAADFISMYLAIELQSICFYVLAAFKRDSEFSTEAGLNYFLLGVLQPGMLLFGCSLIYGFTGVIEFSELSKVFASQNVLCTTMCCTYEWAMVCTCCRACSSAAVLASCLAAASTRGWSTGRLPPSILLFSEPVVVKDALTLAMNALFAAMRALRASSMALNCCREQTSTSSSGLAIILANDIL